MSFHKEDRAKYVESSRRLFEEMLESLAEYFDNIFNTEVADGSWRRNANARSSNASDARCVTSFASGMMRRCAT
jgi:hypothetical protein